MPYADMITLQQAGDYEGIMNFQWGSDFPDAAGNLMPLFLSTNTPPQNNHFYYNNPEVDKLLNDSDAETGRGKRAHGLFKEAQKSHLGRSAGDLPRALQVVPAHVDSAGRVHPLTALVLGFDRARSGSDDA